MVPLILHFIILMNSLISSIVFIIFISYVFIFMTKIYIHLKHFELPFYMKSKYN